MSAAITEGYAGVARLLPRTETERPMTDDQAIALLEELAQKMRAAEEEFGHPQVPTISGVRITAVWDEQT